MTRQQSYQSVNVPTRAPMTLRIKSKFLKGSFCVLRIGLFLQLSSLITLLVVYFIATGGMFNYALIGSPDAIRDSVLFRSAAAILALVYIAGTLYISLFQLLMSDDAAWCRGFRSGSKLISSATSLDLCSAVLQFILYFHLVYHYSQSAWIQMTQGGTEWLLGAFARLLHAISAFSYGTGFFLLEIYHDEGTSALLAVLILFGYLASAVIETASFVYPGYLFGPLLSCIAVLCAFVWALAFERELNSCTPNFHETELTNEVETQVLHYMNYYADASRETRPRGALHA